MVKSKYIALREFFLQNSWSKKFFTFKRLTVKEEILEVKKELWELMLRVNVVKGKVNTVTIVTFSHPFLFSVCLSVGV